MTPVTALLGSFCHEGWEQGASAGVEAEDANGTGAHVISISIHLARKCQHSLCYAPGARRAQGTVMVNKPDTFPALKGCMFLLWIQRTSGLNQDDVRL